MLSSRFEQVKDLLGKEVDSQSKDLLADHIFESCQVLDNYRVELQKSAAKDAAKESAKSYLQAIQADVAPAPPSTPAPEVAAA